MPFRYEIDDHIGNTVDVGDLDDIANETIVQALKGDATIKQINIIYDNGSFWSAERID